MTEKRFKTKIIDKEVVFDEETCQYYDNPNELIKLLNRLSEENKRLNDFRFNYTENRSEFNKDELQVEDAHTKINLKNGKLTIMVFVPEINDYFKFNYMVTGRRLMYKFNGDLE